METENLSFSVPELWCPYSEPEVTLDHQGVAEGSSYFANFFADSQNPSRSDEFPGLVFGS